MDIETLELADATREQAQATERQTEVLAAHVKALAGVSKGEQGVKGDTGEVGPVGPIGKSIRGPMGPPGLDGRNGKDGATGTDGKRGPIGPAGKDGVGPDEQVRVSKKDPVPGFLADKLKAGLGVRLRQEKSPDGDQLVIDSVGQSGGMGGGGMAGVTVYDDGVAVGFGDKLSFDGGNPPTISGGIVHIPVGTGGTGGGLPPQWTDGGNGNVTATTDDNTKTALTIVGLAGQLQNTPLLNLKRDTGENAFRVSQDPTPGYSAVLGDDAGNTAFQQWGTDAEPGVYNQSTFRLYVSGQKVGFDSYEDLVDPTQSYTQVRLQMHTGQVLPVLRLLFDSGDPALQVLATGAIASVDSLGLFGVTPPAQQTIDAPNATPEQIANILIAYGLAVQSP